MKKSNSILQTTKLFNMKKILLTFIISLFFTCGIIAQTEFDRTMDGVNYYAGNPWSFNPGIGDYKNGNYQMPMQLNNGHEDYIRGTLVSNNVSLVSRVLGGPAYCVVAQGSYTYVGAGGALMIYDCVDPNNSILVGSLQLGNRTSSTLIKYIYAKDNFVYVANDFEGLWIIDISDPANPFKASQVDLAGISMSVFVQDNFAYVSTGIGYEPFALGALWVIDVSDPLNPEITGNNTSIGFSAGISVMDTCAYICSPFTSSINIVNISNPSDPQLIRNYILSGTGYVFNIQVQEEIAYVTGDVEGLYIVDVSDPEWPTMLSNYIPPGWAPMGQAMDIAVSDGIVYLAGLFHIFIADVFDPSNPIHLAAYSVEDDFFHTSVAISGSALFVATQNTGLYTSDISDPSTPLLTDSDMTGASCTDVIVNDNYAYASQTYNGTRVIDLSNINEPSEVAFFGVWPEHTSYSSCFKDDILYVSGYMSPAHVLDVANPLDPVEIASWPDYPTYNTQIIDNQLYATTGDEVFYILDITDPTNPAMTSSYTAQYTSDLVLTYGLKVKDIDNKRYAFVAVFCYSFTGGTEYGDVLILDVTDPTNIIEISNIPGNRPYDVDISGNYLYISESGVFPDIAGGIKVVDITDPSDPIEKGSWLLADPPATGFDIAVSGNMVYLAAAADGLRVIDVSYPDNPTEVGYFNTLYGTSARGITLKESGSEYPYVLVASSNNGLMIFQYVKPVGIENNNKYTVEADMHLTSYPNPFSSNATISYKLKEPGKTVLNIYNIQGQLINTMVDEYQESGKHSIIWNGNDKNGKKVTNGTYLYKLLTGTTSVTKKMLLLN